MLDKSSRKLLKKLQAYDKGKEFPDVDFDQLAEFADLPYRDAIDSAHYLVSQGYVEYSTYNGRIQKGIYLTHIGRHHTRFSLIKLRNWFFSKFFAGFVSGVLVGVSVAIIIAIIPTT